MQPNVITDTEQSSLQPDRSCDSSPLISVHSDNEEFIGSPQMGYDELTQYSRLLSSPVCNYTNVLMQGS